MTLRVIQWGTGKTGIHGLRALMQHPELELVGVHVFMPEKDGLTAGEISGLGPSARGASVRATRDIDALVALKADAVCFMGADRTLTDPRVPGTPAYEQIDVMCRLLASGKHLVSTAIVGMCHPSYYGPAVYDRIDAACAKGRVAQYTTGIEPGFSTDFLAAALSSMSGSIDSVRTGQILNYTDYHHVPTFNAYGFGKMPDDPVTQTTTYSRRYITTWQVVVESLADALGVKLEDVRQTVDVALAPEAFDTPMGPVPKGSICGHWFQIRGIVDGKPKIITEHISRLRHADVPEWPRMSNPNAQGFFALIEGHPRMKIDLEMGQQGGMNGMLASMIGTASRAVNTVPYLVQCSPGAKSMFDVPLITGRGRLKRT